MIKIHDNQYNCADAIISKFESKCHYVILNAQMQLGKTGVMMGLINHLNDCKGCREALNIDKFIYVTADNQDICNQTKEDYDNLCNNGTHQINLQTMFCKLSDMMKVNKSTFDCDNIKNALILIDESHYGTKKDSKVLNKFLIKLGVNGMHGNNDLASNSNYIVSVSATPWNEIDTALQEIEKNNGTKINKECVRLETPPTYRGIRDFLSNGQIRWINNTINKDKLELSNIMSEILTHLNNIKKKNGVKKAVIIRTNGNNGVDIIKDVFKSPYFEIKELYCKDGGKINLDTFKNFVAEYCIINNTPEFECDAFPIIIIKGTFRMGKRIEPYIKSKIGAIVDISKGDPSTTAQGLMGRMCGHIDKAYTDNDSKDTLFYIHSVHEQPFVDYYINGLNTPYQIKIDENGKSNKGRTIKEYVAINNHIHQEFDITYDELGMSRDYLISQKGKQKNVEKIMDYVKDKYFNDSNDRLNLARRLIIDEKSFSFSKRERNKSRVISDGRRNLFNEKYIGKKCYTLHLDARGKDKAHITMLFSEIGKNPNYENIIDNNYVSVRKIFKSYQNTDEELVEELVECA